MIPRSLALLALLGMGAACGDEMDDRPASLRYITATIFRPNCATSNCHSERTAVKDVDLHDADSAYESLMGEGKYIDLTEEGHITLSDILRGYQRDRMPPDQPLPDADIELIERWIAEGAKDN